jgi:hypothetical protein
LVSAPSLTETEARVLWTYLTGAVSPRNGYPEWLSALRKLCELGGGYTCRDCTELGMVPSRYGGFCCKDHKAQEDERFKAQGA